MTGVSVLALIGAGCLAASAWFGVLIYIAWRDIKKDADAASQNPRWHQPDNDA